MDHGAPGLFDLPETEPEPATQQAPKRPRRARNRETWTCTVTAAVTVIDVTKVRGATEPYLANTVVVDAFTGEVITELRTASRDVGHRREHRALLRSVHARGRRGQPVVASADGG